MTKLTPTAKSSLEILQEKHLAYTIAKSTIENELKRELTNRLAVIRHERDMAIRLAADAGVPKTQLGRIIGTSNYKTIQDILALTESVLSSSQVANASGKVSVVAEGDGKFLVHLTNVGDQSVSGSAIIGLDSSGSIELISGDAFVIPQIYRNDLLDVVVEQIQKSSY